MRRLHTALWIVRHPIYAAKWYTESLGLFLARARGGRAMMEYTPRYEGDSRAAARA